MPDLPVATPSHPPAPTSVSVSVSVSAPNPIERVCPATRVFDLIGHKWTLAILRTLEVAGGPVRFRQLQRRMGVITPKELTRRLRELERGGLVARAIFAEVPPRVEYTLTPLGQSLGPALEGMHHWALDHAEEIDRNRAAFDGAGG